MDLDSGEHPTNMGVICLWIILLMFSNISNLKGDSYSKISPIFLGVLLFLKKMVRCLPIFLNNKHFIKSKQKVNIYLIQHLPKALYVLSLIGYLCPFLLYVLLPQESMVTLNLTSKYRSFLREQAATPLHGPFPPGLTKKKNLRLVFRKIISSGKRICNLIVSF